MSGLREIIGENLVNQRRVAHCHYEQRQKEREQENERGKERERENELGHTTHENRSICLKKRKKHLRGISENFKCYNRC